MANSPFYRGAIGPGHSSPMSSDECDGLNKVVENLQSIVGWGASATECKAAAQAFQKALAGPNASSAYYDRMRLPKFEVANAAGNTGNVVKLDRTPMQVARPGVTNVGNAAIGTAGKVGASAIADVGTHAPGPADSIGVGAGQPDIQGLVHTASTMADPIGFLRAIFELLKMFCPASLGTELLEGTGQLINGLPPMEIYNIGYEASLDTMKNMGQT